VFSTPILTPGSRVLSQKFVAYLGGPPCQRRRLLADMCNELQRQDTSFSKANSAVILGGISTDLINENLCVSEAEDPANFVTGGIQN
jgi:hypothetical protein